MDQSDAFMMERIKFTLKDEIVLVMFWCLNKLHCHNILRDMAWIVYICSHTSKTNRENISFLEIWSHINFAAHSICQSFAHFFDFFKINFHALNYHFFSLHFSICSAKWSRKLFLIFLLISFLSHSINQCCIHAYKL